MPPPVAQDVSQAVPDRAPVLTPDQLHARANSLCASLYSAVAAGSDWEGRLVDLAVFLDYEVVPAITGQHQDAMELVANAERLPMVQDPREAVLIADHVLYLLDRVAPTATS